MASGPAVLDDSVSRIPRLSVVVPCYNEESVIAECARRLVAACSAVVGQDYELVFVNDGSRDATWDVLLSLAAASGQIVAVNLSRNQGHQSAVTAGLSLSRGERVLMIDADLQDPPELLGEMMAAIDAGADVVYGQRVARDGEGLFKRATAFVFYRLLSVFSEVDIPKDTGDFRLMTRTVVDALNQMPEQHRFVRGMVAWLGFTQVPLRYSRQRRYAGRTKYSAAKMIRFAIDAVTSFSIAPLRLSSLLALFCFVLAGGLGVWVLYAWLRLRVLQGWTSLAILFLFFSGVQLLMLGVIGEYVGRTYVEAKRRPLFVIREVVTQRSVVADRQPR